METKNNITNHNGEDVKKRETIGQLRLKPSTPSKHAPPSHY
jgi:hypothetical protein